VNFLLVHQNFPGQFRHVGRVLAEQGHAVVAIGDAANVAQRPPLHPAIQLLAYCLDNHEYRAGTYPKPVGAGTK
jgi:hypothetical protein